jgi:CRISPR/Cas system CSM-associated protein Csm3 (group 7 of RAMP superfamily)
MHNLSLCGGSNMTRPDRLQLSYQLTFATPLHFGTGLRVGLIDRTIVRDHDGFLYVPGSTIKGVLREHCELLAHLYEELDPEMYEAIASPHDEKKALWTMGRRSQPTMITRIFGSHSSPGRLFFDDAHQTDAEKRLYESQGDYKNLQTDLSTQVRIDRPSRTAARGALYTSEFGIKGLTFEGKITGWLECIETEIPATISPGETPAKGHSPTYSLLLLLAGLSMLDRIGGSKSTGKGQCTCTITELRYGGVVSTKEDWQSWLDHLDALSYYSSAVQEVEAE